MKIAVAGGTGLVGSAVVANLRDAGHEPVVLSRSTGVDLTAAEGLDDALTGVDAVIDTTTAEGTAEETIAFFGTVTSNLLAAEQRADVGHHVALSILDMGRAPDNAHYAGKHEQERLVREGPIPWTILRAPQFFEFAEMMVGWTREGDRATVPPIRVRAAAAKDVGAELARLAAGEPARAVVDLVGPEVVDLADVARRATAAHGDSVEIIASFDAARLAGADDSEPGEPPPGAVVTSTTLEQWLNA